MRPCLRAGERDRRSGRRGSPSPRSRCGSSSSDYNSTQESVFAVTLFHGVVNVAEFSFPNYGSRYDPVVTGRSRQRSRSS